MTSFASARLSNDVWVFKDDLTVFKQFFARQALSKHVCMFETAENQYNIYCSQQCMTTCEVIMWAGRYEHLCKRILVQRDCMHFIVE